MERQQEAVRHYSMTSILDDEQRLTFPKANGEPLLPGLPDDIISAHVVPKLGWRDYYALSVVNTAWCHAIRSRQVYDARVRTNSTETHFLLCNERHKLVPAVSVYSMEDNSWFELPLMPPEWGGVEHEGVKCLGLDGNIYLFGHNASSYETLETYVFDLAGQRHWRKCAPMRTDGYFNGYKCRVLNGKIYLVGGVIHTSSSNRGRLDVVYDPVEDTWSPIQSVRSLRMGHHVTATQDELVVYGGFVYDELSAHGRDRNGVTFLECEPAAPVQIYHPGRNEWRAVNGFRGDLIGQLVLEAKGELHTLTGNSISSFTLDGRESTVLHSISPRLLGPEYAACSPIHPVVAAHAGDEILAIANFYTSGRQKKCLLRCKGLGGQNKALFWERAETPSFFPTLGSSIFLSLCSIRL